MVCCALGSWRRGPFYRQLAPTGLNVDTLKRGGLMCLSPRALKPSSAITLPKTPTALNGTTARAHA